MDSDDHKHTKVVRFSGNEEKNIQFNNIGQPLFSSARSIKYIAENRYRDICVADCGANAVVIVIQNGKFSFKYNPYTPKGRLKPYGIATDSHGWILVSDENTDYIHILDQEGAFLRFIDNCDLIKFSMGSLCGQQRQPCCCRGQYMEIENISVLIDARNTLSWFY